MARYSREIIREVVAANDIVEVIGAYLDLKPSGGRRWKALSPFSQEKTPSFLVSQDRQTFHCFSTDQGGDALSFLMKVEGLTFAEALRKLAERAGIQLPAASRGEEKADSLRSQLAEFNAFAAGLYRRLLEEPLKGSAARKYLEGRALKPQTMQRFGLGFAPDSFSTMLDAAADKGWSRDVLDASGLFKESERGRQYDFFRNRITFPIKDISGNVVAFGGRDLGDSPAKYINSPETALYKKARVLYGLHDAREAIRKAGFAVLVEGYFDLLRCFDAGIENVVATCGTALTEEQANLVRRYAGEVVLVYDGDAAGIKAALKGTRLLAAAGLTVRAAALPGGQDPDDFVKAEGAEAMRQVLEEAPDFVTFYATMSEARLTTIEGRTAVAHELFEIVRGMNDELRADAHLKAIGKALGLSDWACRKEYEKLRRGEARPRPNLNEAQDEPKRRIPKDEIVFVAALLQEPSLLAQVREAEEAMQADDPALAEVLEALLEQGTSVDVHGLGGDAARLFTAAAGQEPVDEEQAKGLVEKRMNRMRRAALENERARMQDKIRRVEKTDPAALSELMVELVRIGQRIERLGAA
ncbi:MAG: DNA primase [Candidatus Hydrogenedens sp.]|nr:DNA primase [Candidatus Hydrogenedens sp.]